MTSRGTGAPWNPLLLAAATSLFQKPPKQRFKKQRSVLVLVHKQWWVVRVSEGSWSFGGLEKCDLGHDSRSSHRLCEFSNRHLKAAVRRVTAVS